MTRKPDMTPRAARRLAPLLAVVSATAAVTITLASDLLGGWSAPGGAQAAPATFDRHRAALLAQCKPNPRVSPEAASKLPIHVTKWGTSGPKVLVIHGGEQTIDGIGGGPGNFSGQKPLSDEGWQINLPERPGFGASPSRGRDDQPADVRWIAAMLRDGGGANLWGHSFGGAEALLAAGETPTSVRSLVLVEPDLWPLAAAVPADQVPEAVADEIQTRQRSLMASRSPAGYASRFMSSFQPKHGGFEVWIALHALKLAPGLRKKVGCGALQAREASGEDFRRAIETVKAAKIPVLIVTGGWSPARDAMGEWVARMIGGEHVIVPSANHLVMKENPGAFNARVAAFMRAAEHSRSAVSSNGR